VRGGGRRRPGRRVTSAACERGRGRDSGRNAARCLQQRLLRPPHPLYGAGGGKGARQRPRRSEHRHGASQPLSAFEPFAAAARRLATATTALLHPLRAWAHAACPCHFPAAPPPPPLPRGRPLSHPPCKHFNRPSARGVARPLTRAPPPAPCCPPHSPPKGTCRLTTRVFGGDGRALRLSFPCKPSSGTRAHLSGPALNLWAYLNPGLNSTCAITTLSPSIAFKRVPPSFYYGYAVSRLACAPLEKAAAAKAMVVGDKLAAGGESRSGVQYGLWLVPELKPVRGWEEGGWQQGGEGEAMGRMPQS
jgi:hypothetical protein